MSDTDSTLRCKDCDQAKPEGEFYRDKRSSTGRTQPCKVCISAIRKRYYQENREERIAYVKKWTEENCEQRAAYLKRYYQENKERRTYDKEANRERQRLWIANNPEKNRARTREWELANPDKVRARKSRRRAMEREATGEFDAEILRQMYDDQEGLCAYCEGPLFGRFHIDHMIPLSRGGAHDWRNIAIACPECNHGKHATTPLQFMARLGYEPLTS